MTTAERTSLVRRISAEVGFDRVGVAPPGPPPHAEFLRTWLARGSAGRMAYMHRHLSIRLDPRQLLPGARSVICVAANHHQRPPKPTSVDPNAARGDLTQYAWGQDYHVVVRERLDALLERLRREAGEAFDARPFVDTAPVLERPLAAAAGLGWIGKNTLLIVPRLGSFVYLGGIVTTLALDPDDAVPDRCGRCTRCMDACPTGALVEPYVMDARRCISYLTIELRGTVPIELRSAMGDRVFGCDVCQRVCPHNRRAPVTTDPKLQARPPAPSIPLRELLSWSRDTYLQATRGRASRRAKLGMLRRNAAIALGNVGGPDDVPALRAIESDDDAVLAEHARWAVAEIQKRSNPPHP